MACLVRDLFQGPLVALRGFHPSTIKWCSMHVINLGLCYGVNGGGLHFDIYYFLPLFEYYYERVCFFSFSSTCRCLSRPLLISNQYNIRPLVWPPVSAKVYSLRKGLVRWCWQFEFAATAGQCVSVFSFVLQKTSHILQPTPVYGETCD